MSNLISAKQLENELDNKNLIIIDCRYNLAAPNEGLDAFLDNHIKNAQYLHPDTDLASEIIPGTTGRHPLPRMNDFQNTLENIGLNSDSHVVCYDASGGAIAVRAWWLIKYCGFENVSVLDGGWQSWVKSGFSTTDQINPVQLGNFKIQLNSDWVISADELLTTKDEYDLFDARANERYHGQNETIDPIAGHIPGAISAPFTENLDANGQFLPKESLKQRFETLSTGKTSVHYCGSGVTACHNWFAMTHAGLTPGKLYPGSWSDWITDSNRPVEL